MRLVNLGIGGVGLESRSLVWAFFREVEDTVKPPESRQGHNI